MHPRVRRESALEKDCRKATTKAGGLFLKLGGAGMNGIPDRMVLLPGGKFWFVELKRKGKEPEPLQVVWGKRLLRMGYNYAWIDDLDAFKELILGSEK